MALSIFFFTFNQLYTIESFAQNFTQGSTQTTPSYATVVQAAQRAYANKDYTAYRDNLRAALQLRPKHAALLYRLAVAHALLGASDSAIAQLSTIAAMGIIVPAAKNPDLASLRELPAFQAVLKRLENNTKLISTTIKAFEFWWKESNTPDSASHTSQTGLITEGLAFDAQSNSFFVSSVRKRTIFRVQNAGTARQTIQEFARAEKKGGSVQGDSLFGCFGMAVDAGRRELWVATSAIEQMENFSPSTKGRAGLVCYDLKTGKRLQTLWLPASDKEVGENVIGDVAIAPNGDVFATNSLSPEILVVRRTAITAGKPHLERWLVNPDFASLQGICFDERGTMFVADYANGIWAINPQTSQTLQTLRCTKIPYPDTSTLLGVDGLYYFHERRGASLLAIQNGTNPNRLLRLWLNATHTAIERVETLEANNPLFDDPTLGVIHGKELYYIANGQWGAFDDAGKPKAGYPLKTPTIMKATLTR